MRERLRAWWRKITQDIRNNNYEPWCILALLLVSASAIGQAPDCDGKSLCWGLTKEGAILPLELDVAPASWAIDSLYLGHQTANFSVGLHTGNHGLCISTELDYQGKIVERRSCDLRNVTYAKGWNSLRVNQALRQSGILKLVRETK